MLRGKTRIRVAAQFRSQDRLVTFTASLNASIDW